MDRLRELLGDPPAGVTPVDWTSVTEQLGLELPADYRALFDVYPAMIVDDVLIYRPSSDGLDILNENVGTDPDEAILGIMRGRQENSPSLYPYPYFPAKNGLVFWGRTYSGTMFYWLATGPADSWPVIIEDCHRYWTYTGSTTEFLVELFEGRLPCPFYGPYDPGDRIEKITWF